MRFNLAQEKTETLKEYLVKMLRGKLLFNEFYALKDVSFQVRRGEAVALIGRNGSGKSTMLKVVAGVMYPSKGACSVQGSIAPMIELGAGFDMDLTARENVFLTARCSAMTASICKRISTISSTLPNCAILSTCRSRISPPAWSQHAI